MIKRLLSSFKKFTGIKWIIGQLLMSEWKQSFIIIIIIIIIYKVLANILLRLRIVISCLSIFDALFCSVLEMS